MPLENKMNDLHMELKVCEGCGALWLRTGALNGVYCRGCRSTLAEFPVARGRRAPLGPRSKRGGHSSPVESRSGIAMAGGAR